MKNSKKSSSRINGKLVLLLAVVILLAAVLLNICLGASGMSLSRLWEALVSGPGTSSAARILWYVRLPRTAATLLSGAALATAGAVIQKVLANQLASPHIIGVNAGAGLAVAVCSAIGLYTAWAVAGFAFAGALGATFLVVAIGRKIGAARTTVVLSGVAVTACLSAVTEGITTMVPDVALANADFRVGGFSSVNQSRLLPCAILVVAAVIVVCSLSHDLEVLSLGDDTAQSLGIKVTPMRNFLLTMAALLAGTSVMIAGILGFVGLIVPHIARKLIGNSSTLLLPFCAITGAALVSVCDLAARMIFSPYELPTGILLSAIGGPFFVWLLLKRREKKQT